MYQELKDLIENGDDIEFSLFGKRYSVIPLDDSVVIGLKYGDALEFSDVDSMMNQYSIDGQPLKNVLDQVEIERIY